LGSWSRALFNTFHRLIDLDEALEQINKAMEGVK